MATKEINTESTRDVLIAEDSRVQAELLRRRLVEAGYQARVAVNGAEALRQVRERKPHIIVSDIEMPELDGYGLCRAVKEDPLLRDVPFILLSSLSQPADIIEGLHVGADNYVTKPYEPDYLIARIAALLETPIIDEQEVADDKGLEVTLAGKRYIVKPGRHQTLNLLVSTFENAVEKNRELIRVNEELTVVQDRLEQQNRQLQVLNEQMAAVNDRMTRDLEAAAEVQQSLLPASLPETSAINFAWNYWPCDELAGDFLSIFSLDDRHIGLYVVDVSGHGVAASLLAVTVSRVLTVMPDVTSLLLSVAEDSGERVVTPPPDVLAELNRRFPMELSGERYFTILYGVLDLETKKFRYSSAGHPPLVVLRSDGEPEVIQAEGMPVGWIEDADYDERSIDLKRGDRLWLYSDGVPEAMDESGQQFETDRMLRSIIESRYEALENSADQLLQDVEQWCGGEGPKDDVSVLALEVAQ